MTKLAVKQHETKSFFYTISLKTKLMCVRMCSEKGKQNDFARYATFFELE